MLNSRQNHPVWTVYDKLRTARLNVKYYGRRLSSIERINLIMEFILLASAPSSAIAGLWFLEHDLGKMIWQYLGVVAGITAILKPLLNLPKQIKEFESVLSGYRILEYDLMEIKVMVEQQRKYDAVLQSEFKKSLQREKQLVSKTPETRERKKVKTICEGEVLKELPESTFYVPED